MTPHDAEHRRRIREDLGTSFLVEAAAGTGKTHCFVDRVVEAIATGRANVQSLVAVTFTRKAAGELRLRIRRGLFERRTQVEAPSRDRIDDALLRLEEAQIGTIHGFCADLLRRHPVWAGVDPGFVEMDRDEARVFLDRAFSRWFERGLERADPALLRALARAEAARDAPRRWLLKALEDVVDLRDLGSQWAPAEHDLLAAARSVWPALVRVAERVETTPSSQLEATRKMRLELVAEAHRAWAHRFADDDIDPIALEGDLVYLARELQAPRRRMYGAWTDEVSAPAVEKEIRELLERLRRYRQASDQSLAPALKASLEGALADYDALKRAAGRLDAVDLLLRSRELLRRHAEVRRAEASRLEFIGVDELQDTDPVQTEVLMLLAQHDFEGADWRRVRPDPGRVFLVGDPKQAIYGFRRASMSFYLDMRRGLLDAGLERLELTQSFRALAPIQNLVNLTFAPTFGSPDAPAPGQPGYVPLAGGPPARDDQPAIMVVSGQLSRVSKHWDWRRLQDEHARACMRSLCIFCHWLVEKSGFRVRDGLDDALEPRWRPVQARDVAILFRKMSFSYGPDRVAVACDELERLGVPFTLSGRSRLAERDEVEALRNGLRAIEWPSDELAVHATLAGPLFAIPDEELWSFRRSAGRLHPLEARPPDHGEPAVAEALDLLRTLHEQKADRSVVGTLSALLGATRALAGFAHEPAGSEVLAHIDVVFELARAYEQRAPASIRGFLEELDRTRELDAHERPVEEHVDGVRVTNVHKAKGLEFPVVILADPHSPQRGSDRRYVDPSSGQAAFEIVGCRPRELDEAVDRAREASEAEENRLAYVAATRARDLLVVPGYGFGLSEMKVSTKSVSWFGPFHENVYPRVAEPTRLDVMGGDPEDPFSAFEPDDSPRVLPEPIRAGEYFAAPETPYVWVARSILRPTPVPRAGLAREDALDPRGSGAEAAISAHEAWKASRHEAVAAGRRPSETLIRASQAYQPPPGDPVPVRVEAVPRRAGRPSGARFGQLVHDVLEVAPWDAKIDQLMELARHAARSMGAVEVEIEHAAWATQAAQEHELLRAAAQAEACHREWPITLRTDQGEVMDGVIDLLYFADGRWTVVDYKTGRLQELALEASRHQVSWYVRALQRAFRAPVRGVLLQV